MPPSDPRIYEDELYRKNNYRAVKALMKVYEDGRKKNSSDCMNMLGLDIKKIHYISNPSKNGESLNKFDKIKIKDKRNVSPPIYRAKETARTQLLRRNTTESSESDSRPNYKKSNAKFMKLEMAESAYLYRTKKEP